MKVQERNRMIAECIKDISMAKLAYEQQLEIIASKYGNIPNFAEYIKKTFAIEGCSKELMAECIGECQRVHDEYFPRGKPLDDTQWRKCIEEMDAVKDKYKNDIPELVGGMCMAYLNDIEEYDKKWIEHLKKGNT